MTDQTPATEAGRRLAVSDTMYGDRAGLIRGILAIEAEARADGAADQAHRMAVDTMRVHDDAMAEGRADALREAADAVRAVLTEHSSDNGQYVKWGGDALLHDMQAVLAILDPQP